MWLQPVPLANETTLSISRMNSRSTTFFLICIICSVFQTSSALAQHSVARQWNEVLLEAIRKDNARPTVHGRNLFHTAIAMYDSWAIYDQTAAPYLLGETVHGFTCPFSGIADPANIQDAREATMSYAFYRLMRHRFTNSPGAAISIPLMDSLMIELGYDTAFASQDYSTGSAEALGNHLAQNLIDFGLQDNSNEQANYVNQFYQPSNTTLLPIVPGNPNTTDENHWQPLTLDVYIDQSGNIYPITTPEFLSPEWGTVHAFALSQDDLTIHSDGLNDYWAYHDPGTPPLLDTGNVDAMGELYQWNFSLVSIWSSHLDSTSNVMWDISPASIGNVQSYPTDQAAMPSFYNLYDGGDPGQGHALNPSTGQPYTPQMVPRSDYARVLAEFWADGPDSETPPGHWFTLLNYVSDHQDFEKKYEGIGDILPDLEWDVKSYFTLAGAVHDAAVTAWGVKGWYDYLRPISAIRFMSDLGQSTYDTLSNYHPAGIPLYEDYIEIVGENDPLAIMVLDTTWLDTVNFYMDTSYANAGKIKVFAWRGPDYIGNPDSSLAGVGWILAENWWPYQRPTFVTPPFAGFVSGHSTFSRAAAEVMEMLTGDPFFPGGMGEFTAPMNEFLVFEDGPSIDITLQWATYRDASDQCSLSRIWGGIHPPADDIPGRLMGAVIGPDAFELAKEYFEGSSIITGTDEAISEISIYPNPSADWCQINSKDEIMDYISVTDLSGKVLSTVIPSSKRYTLNCSNWSTGTYLINIGTEKGVHSKRLIIQ
ncbi:MAG: hypothetical protein ACI85F_000827 [Bacteroidia bacterium]|jgi:hypothetical protein